MLHEFEFRNTSSSRMEMIRFLLLTVTLLVLLSHLCNGDGDGEEVKVNVETATSIAETDDNFICATLDWWPVDKCDYGQCPWGKAGILNLDLDNKILANAIKAFNPLRLRIGGSLQDQVIYKANANANANANASATASANASAKAKAKANASAKANANANAGRDGVDCHPFHKKKEGTLFGFTGGCLGMERWDQLANLFNKTGALITFGLNALHGKQKANTDPNDKLWVGVWDGSNAIDFIMYNADRGYKIDSWELGNELCGDGVSARVEAEQYGKDMIRLREIVTDVYPPPNTPKVLGPAGFYDKKWFDTFLQVSGPGTVDGVTHHIYDLGPGNDPELIHRIQDPYYLSQTTQTFKDVSTSVKRFGPWSGAWVGEAGGAYNSGGKEVSHTFVDGFWYLDQLGTTSTFNHKVYCRQAFIGGNYALLNTTTFIPNPDYYGALLWHRLMGKKVLAVSHNSSPYLRVYSHCSKSTTGITVLIINMSNSTTFDVSVINDMNLYSGRKLLDVTSDEREEYHLTPKDGNIQSDELLLNGTPVKLTESLDIPALNPQLVDPTLPISVGPDSIVFATLKGFKAPVCER